MKNLMFKLVILITLGITIFSCNKVVKDSVDSGILENKEPISEFKDMPTKQFQGLNNDFDDWYQENNHRLNEISREEIIAFEDLDVQVMIFNIIPPERKALVWREKFDELLHNEQYNNEQKAFINSLRDRVQPDLYLI